MDDIGGGSRKLAWLCLFLCLSSSAMAEIYSWKDANGKMHFGDRKLEGVNQKAVLVRSHKSSWKTFEIEINDVNGVLTTKEREQIKKDVNNVYQFYDKSLYFDIYKTVPVKIRLFEMKSDYEKYTSSKYQTNGKHSRGIYFSSTNEIVVYLNASERFRTFLTIKHETSHAIVDTLTPFIPSWLNEGLAENMEVVGFVEVESGVEDGGFYLGPHEENYRSLSWYEGRGRMLSVKKFLSLTSAKFREQQRQGRSPNQVHAGELVRMFLSRKTGKSFITRLVHIYERGSNILSAYPADEHYIGGLRVMQDDWDRWVRRSRSERIVL